MLGVVAAKGSSARAPAGRRELAAAGRIAPVELDQVVAATADVVRMRVDGRVASTAECLVDRQTVRVVSQDDGNLTSPGTSNHGASVPGSGEIVELERSRVPGLDGRGEQRIGRGDATRPELRDPAGPG